MYSDKDLVSLFLSQHKQCYGFYLSLQPLGDNIIILGQNFDLLLFVRDDTIAFLATNNGIINGQMTNDY